MLRGVRRLMMLASALVLGWAILGGSVSVQVCASSAVPPAKRVAVSARGAKSAGKGQKGKKSMKDQNKTPFSAHGALHVKGTDLVDQNGNVVQLKGISTHGIAWYPQYINEKAFQQFRDEWGVNLIRLAMYTEEYGGWCNGGDQKKLADLIDQGVKAATDLGMYVIIDWHILSDGNPLQNESAAEEFWKTMSRKYAGNDNVLYEICNEPNGSGVTWKVVKQYADTIIPLIRANDPDAVILCGTPTWSQDVDQVAADPLEDPANVMYTLHFYAATHKDDLRRKLKTAEKAGTPVFISEFSICDASGNGGIDCTSADAWKKLIQEYHLSFAGWNLSNKDEASAVLKPSCTRTSGFRESDYSETGLWLKNLCLGQ